MDTKLNSLNQGNDLGSAYYHYFETEAEVKYKCKYSLLITWIISYKKLEVMLDVQDCGMSLE